MSGSMCVEVRELAPELALGTAGGPERAEALQHASECGPCLALIGELSEAADALPLLAPEAEPPPGFEERVLAALKAPRRRNRRRIVGVRVVESVQETNGIATAASDVRAAQMTGANGLDVGDVFVSNGVPAAVVVSVNYWVPSGTYDVEFRAGSTSKRLGDVHIDNGRGSWGGVAELSRSAAGSIVLVGTDGKVVCEARLAPVS